MKSSTRITRLCQTTMVALLALALGNTALLAAADANPPERSTYQGYLVDGEGTALGNSAPKNYEVIFRIFDSQSGGNKKWAEHQTVTVDKGYFSVLLGEGAAVGSEPRPVLSALFAATDASDRFVEMTVKGIGSAGSDSTIAPRLRLLTSAYAFLAKQASQIVNSTGTPLLTANESTVSVAGNVNAAGTVNAAIISAGHHAGGTMHLAGSIKGDSLEIAGLSAALNVTAHNHVHGASINATGNIGAGGRLDAGGDFAAANVDSRGHVQGTYLHSHGSVQAVFDVNAGETMRAKRLYSRNSDTTQFHLESNQANLIVNDAFLVTTSYGGMVAAFIRDVLRMHNKDDKSKHVDFYRDSEGLKISLYNGIKTPGAWTWVGYDGDSNWDWPSDRRLKTNIVDAENLLDRVMAVQMRRFQWKGRDPNTRPELGVIAQEFMQLFPELVSQQPPDEKIPECPDGPLSVGLTSLGTIAIKAIQELKHEKDAEIAELKKKVASLEAKVEVASTQAEQMKQLVQQMARLEKLVATSEKSAQGPRSTEVAALAGTTASVAK